MIPQPVKWYAVTVDVVPEAAEAVEFAFNTLGAAGTKIDQMPGGSRETQAVVGYFDSTIKETAVRDEILNSLNVYGFDTSALHGLAFADVEKRDWLAECRQLNGDTGISQCKQRHDGKRDPWMQRCFQSLQRRHGLLRGHGEIADDLGPLVRQRPIANAIQAVNSIGDNLA